MKYESIARLDKSSSVCSISMDYKCIGTANLKLTTQDRKARYSIGIFNPTKWNLGLGTEVTKLVLKYAFEELKLHRVDLKVLEYNLRGIRCYEKCGFIFEGKEREGALIGAKYETDVIMSILESEYYRIIAY